jgi:tellurite resistance protein
VGNLLIAAVAVPVRSEYDELAFLWFATGVVFWIVLFTLTFKRVVFGAFFAHPRRSGIFLWLASPSIASLAWVQMTGAFDHVFFFFYFFSVMMVIVLLILVISGYFGRRAWGADYWGYCFPVEAFCLASILYHLNHPTNWTSVSRGWVAGPSLGEPFVLTVITLVVSPASLQAAVRSRCPPTSWPSSSPTRWLPC